MDLSQKSRTQISIQVFTLQMLVLLLLVYPFVSATFRDNDQAAIVSGSWQLARHEAAFVHATFYNFDKQWGTFFGLVGVYRLFPHADPVLSANVLLVVLASLAWISLAFRAGRTRHAPFSLLLPILLSPALILYIPYLGTGWLSLAFLLLAFFCIGDVKSSFRRITVLLLVAAAAACRGDAVLAVPALALSQISRVRFWDLLRQPFPWLLAAASVIPVLFGKCLAGATIPDANPFSFDPRVYFGFLVFGLTPAVVILLLGIIAFLLAVARRKRRFRLFYAGLAIAPLIPFGFYSLQLYTLRYLFLTLASILFVASSRRAAWIYRRTVSRHRWAAIALCALTIVPWLAGVSLPSLTHIALTTSNPTRFPTGDGQFPMGAYLAFEWQVLFRDHLIIDHNQKIWLSARTIQYERCSDGAVPFLITPMSNFLELAIRLQHKRPKPIDYMAESPCGIAYVDARSIIRGYRPNNLDGPLLKEEVKFVSSARNGQQIVRIDSKGQQTTEGQVLEGLRQVFGDRNTEIFVSAGRPLQVPVEPGLQYALFSDQPCQLALGADASPAKQSYPDLIRAVWTEDFKTQNRIAQASCPGSVKGWAKTSTPAYMGSGSHY